jgi:hypothetical protein
MECLDLNACVSAALNTMLATSIVWCLNVMHTSPYLTGIKLYLAIVTVSLNCPVGSFLSIEVWLI